MDKLCGSHVGVLIFVLTCYISFTWIRRCCMKVTNEFYVGSVQIAPTWARDVFQWSRHLDISLRWDPCGGAAEKREVWTSVFMLFLTCALKNLDFMFELCCRETSLKKIAILNWTNQFILINFAPLHFGTSSYKTCLYFWNTVNYLGYKNIPNC